MGSNASATPDPSASPRPDQPATPGPEAIPGAPAAGPHDFEAQKRIHQQIRNDPDYDDWEYGTEPLPHEAWIAARSGAGAAPDDAPTPQPIGEGRSRGG